METIYAYTAVSTAATKKMTLFSMRELSIKKLDYLKSNIKELKMESFKEIKIPSEKWEVDGIESSRLMEIKGLDRKNLVKGIFTESGKPESTFEVEYSEYSVNYLLNAFSLQMLQRDATVRFQEVEKLPEGLKSAIGHADTAAVLGVDCNRVNVSLSSGDVAYVAQLTGGRLPEGCTTLPDGFTFKFIKVEVQ